MKHRGFTEGLPRCLPHLNCRRQGRTFVAPGQKLVLLLAREQELLLALPLLLLTPALGQGISTAHCCCC